MGSHLGLMMLVIIASAVAGVGFGCGLMAGRVRAGEHKPVLQLAGCLEDVQRVVRQLLHIRKGASVMQKSLIETQHMVYLMTASSC